MNRPDDNDLLRAGDLPSDPFEDAVSYDWSAGQSDDSVNCVNSVRDDSWETPLPLAADCPDLPRFPIDALPPVLADFVLALAEQAQVPTEMAACCVLGVISASIAGTHVVEPWPGYQEPTNLWFAPTAHSGTRKSTVIRHATDPVAETEARLDAAGASRRSELAAELKVAKKRLDDLLKRAAKTPEDQDLQADMRALNKECEQLVVPNAPRLFTTNATPEAIPPLLAAHDGRILVVTAEGAEMVTIAAGLYSRGRDNFDVLLKGWSGDQILVDRKNADPIRVDDPALTLVLMFQPSVLAELGSHRTFRGRGFLARFLFCLCEDLVGHRRACTAPIPDAVRDAYSGVVDSLFRIEHERQLRDGDGEWATGPRAPHVIRFGEAAQTVIMEFFAEMESAQRPGRRLYAMRDWASKAHGQAARLAAVLHAAQCQDFSRPADVLLDEQTAENAVRLTRFFLAHALAAFSLMGETREMAQALSIVRHLRRARVKEITRRDLHRAMQAQFESAGDLGSPLALLEDRGYLRVIEAEREPGRPGRRSSPTIVVNPHLDAIDTIDRKVSE